jgi:capsular polysaccharide biosynthesis protein
LSLRLIVHRALNGIRRLRPTSHTPAGQPFDAAIEHNKRAHDLWQEGRLKDALVAARAALRIWPSYVDANINHGYILRDLGNAGKAIRAFRKALELGEGNSAALVALGDIHRRTGRLQQAITSYEQSLRSDPTFQVDHLSTPPPLVSGAGAPSAYVRTHMWLWVTRWSLHGEFEKAREAILRFLAEWPFDGWWAYVLASWMLRYQRNEQASEAAASGVMVRAFPGIGDKIPPRKLAPLETLGPRLIDLQALAIPPRSARGSNSEDDLPPNAAHHGSETRSPVLVKIPGGRTCVSSHGAAIFDQTGRLVHDLSNNDGVILAMAQHLPEPRTFDERLLFLAAGWSDEFFHWMFESLPCIAVASAVQQGPRMFDRILVRSIRPFHTETLAFLGIQADRLLSLHDTGPHVAARELVVIGGMEVTFPEIVIRPWSVRFLRNLVLPWRSDPPTCASRLFIGRRKGNGRLLTNGNDLEPIFAKHRVETIFPEDYSISQQAALFSNAELIIAPVGAALVNLSFCRPGTRVILFYPAGVRWAIYRQVCDIVGARASHLECEAIPSTGRLAGDWTIASNANIAAPVGHMRRLLQEFDSRG